MNATNVVLPTERSPKNVQLVTEAQLSRNSTPQRRLYKKLFHERVTEIRRKGKIAKYKPRVKGSKLEVIKKRRRRGGQAFFMPLEGQSQAFKKIQKHFIEPIVRSSLWSENMSIKDRLEVLFNTNTRDIVPAIVTQDFKMPGVVLDPKATTLTRTRPPLVSEAHFPKGTPIFVRIDDNMPDRIDIENCETEDLMFSLTKLEYKSIINKIEELDGCDYRLDPPGEMRLEDGSFTDLT